MEAYGLKMIYRMTAGKEVFYEESVVLLKADSFDEAYEKAEAYAKDVCGCEYINLRGDTVRTELIEVVDCFEAFAEDNGVQEVYSRTMKNRKQMKEEELIDLLADSCTVEERMPLRNQELNESIAKENGGWE